eukprot:TRINITY_DN10217_c0_g1_i1.p1 TRINITY_DN10217_c0_g1~~TRINITY_DN10217_c0_g1_i1.p1  ORF type:complete len:143 (-),score=27.78 TRINITY_DN10217_c0_g1_i1:271-699(-)
MFLGVAVSHQAQTYTYLLTLVLMSTVLVISGIYFWKNRRQNAPFLWCYGPLIFMTVGILLVMGEPFKNGVVAACTVAMGPEYEKYGLQPLVEHALDFIFLPVFSSTMLWRAAVVGYGFILLANGLQLGAFDGFLEEGQKGQE